MRRSSAGSTRRWVRTAKHEPVLASWDLTASGAKILLHLMAGSREIEFEGSETTPAIRLLMLIGCRPSEIQKLRWKHVDLKAGKLMLPETKTGARVVYLGEPVIAVLRGIQRSESDVSDSRLQAND